MASAISWQPVSVAKILLYLALAGIVHSASAASNVEIRAKQAELARLERELGEMKRVLEQFELLKQRGEYHERTVCGQYYRAAVQERAIIRQRAAIPGYDRTRADAKTRYNQQRAKMIECINKSVAGDGALRAMGVTGYNSLLSLYRQRKANAKMVDRQYKTKQAEANRLKQEIKTLKFGDLGPIRVECPANSDPIYDANNKQSCKCHDSRAEYIWGRCVRLSAEGAQPYTGPRPQGGPQTPPGLLGQDPPR